MSTRDSNDGPIDCMAQRMSRYCIAALEEVDRIQCVVDQSETAGQALDLLVQSGVLPDGDYVHLKTFRDDAPRLQTCINRMQEIKRLARRVFQVNYSDKTAREGIEYVFDQEVSFSYACKMVVSVGPLLRYFSNRPTKDKVIGAELSIAMKTPIYVEDDESDGRVRKTTLVKQISIREAANAVEGVQLVTETKLQCMQTRSSCNAVSNLLCNETMTPFDFVVPLSKQIRRSRPPKGAPPPPSPMADELV